MAKRSQLRRRKRQNRPAPVINPNAAGIDVGATEVYVAVPTVLRQLARPPDTNPQDPTTPIPRPVPWLRTRPRPIQFKVVS